MQRVSDLALRQFVTHLDALEGLVISVYKGKQAGPAQEQDYQRIREHLRVNYPRWQAALAPYWQATKINGQPTPEDPFLRLISPQHARDFIDNWAMMQTLPAARQALNEWLLDTLDGA